MRRSSRKSSNEHFWDVEFYNGPDQDTECQRLKYQDQVLHFVTIYDTAWFIVDDLCRYLKVPVEVGVGFLQDISRHDQTTRKLRKSNGNIYDVALLSEEGTCTFIGAVGTPESYLFLHDLQALLREYHDPDLSTRSKLATKLMAAERHRVEADPDRLKAITEFEEATPPVLSFPNSYQWRPITVVDQPASIYTIVTSVTSHMYTDSAGNIWFDAYELLRVLGYSSITQPATIFRDVPGCWLADLTVVDIDGEERRLLCILSHGVFFYLANATNKYLIYLMYYIALYLTINNKEQMLVGNGKVQVPVPLSSIQNTVKRYRIRYTVDLDNTVWYLGTDVLISLGYKFNSKVLQEVLIETNQYFSDVPQVLKSYKTARLNEIKPLLTNVLFLREGGIWYFLKSCSQSTLPNFMSWFGVSTPKPPNVLKLYRQLTKFHFPYLNSIEDIPYDVQIKSFETFFEAYSRHNLSEELYASLDRLCESTTGISPVEVIKRFEKNQELSTKLNGD